MHQSKANFPDSSPHLQLRLFSPFMVSGAGLNIACDSLSPGTPQLHLAQLYMKKRFISLCASRLWRAVALYEFAFGPPSVVQPPLPQSPASPSLGQKTECDVSSPSPHKAAVHWTHLGQHKGWKARRGLDTQDHAAKPDKDASKVEQQTVAFFSSPPVFFFPGPCSERKKKKKKTRDRETGLTE